MSPRSETRSERGSALVELALIMPFMLLLLLATIEYGHLIQSRMILAGISREGGSIATRQTPIDPDLLTMLAASGRPLTLDGADCRIVVTRIEAGESDQSRDPVITDRHERGGLSVASSIQAGTPQLGLNPALYQRLVFDDTQGTADIAQVTVVEVFYLYRPITPLANFMAPTATPAQSGMLLSSRSVF